GHFGRGDQRRAGPRGYTRTLKAGDCEMLAQGPAGALAGYRRCAVGTRRRPAGSRRTIDSPFTTAVGHRKRPRICPSYRGPDVMDVYQTRPALADAIKR